MPDMSINPNVDRSILSEFDDEPKFPPGLMLTLDDIVLKRLGMNELPETGKEIQITAKARVTGVRDKSPEEPEDRSVDLQLVSLDIPENESDSRADRLFGE